MDFAFLATASAWVKENWPCLDSVTSHFCEFSGVKMPNSFLFVEMAWYAVSLKFPVSVAVPKYNLPAATISECRPSPWVWFWAVAPAARPDTINKTHASLAILSSRVVVFVLLP